MYSTLPFSHLNDYALTNRSKRVFKTDKKTGCVYYEACRFKTNERGNDYNTEVIHLEIDTNLSPNFYVEEINLVSGRSVLCQLTDFEQPRFGNTKLTMSVFYIDELQEQRETTHSFYMPTLPGTVASKLARALDCFRKEAQGQIAKVNNQGFSYGHQRTGEYYASFVLLRAKELDRKRDKWATKIFYESFTGYSPVALNAILLIYSISNGNKLHQPGSITFLESALVNTQFAEWKPRKFLYSHEEEQGLDSAMEFFRSNQEKIFKVCEECGENFRFDEEKFRQGLDLGSQK
jgi:hypothetical protein